MVPRFVGITDQEEFRKSWEPFTERWRESECADRVAKLREFPALRFWS